MAVNRKIGLLPRSFKYFGFGLAAIGFISLILRNSGVLPEQLPTAYFQSAVTVGLMIAAVCREKNENEKLKSIRLKSICFAFTFGVLYTLIDALIKSPTGSIYVPISAQQIIGMILITYHVFFISTKSKSKGVEQLSEQDEDEAV